MTTRKALLVGATGLVGGQVLDRLLGGTEYAKVTVLVRRSLGRKDEKLEEQVVDFDAIGDDPARFGADDVYACLGTTIKIAGTQEKFRRVDHDYTVRIAALAHDAGATRVALVSSVGASEGSSSFYLRVKGETERDVGALGFETTTIARPSFLMGDRKESRPGEAAGVAVARALAFTMVGGLRPYRPIAARAVARALVRATLDGGEGGKTTKVLHHAELTALAEA